MFTTAFARDLGERTIATFAEALAVLLLASGTGLLDASWQTSLSLAGMTALVALLKGVASGYKDPETGASVLSDPPPRVKRNEGGYIRLSPDGRLHARLKDGTERTYEPTSWDHPTT